MTKHIHLKRRSKHTSSASTSGLDLLADAALLQIDTQQRKQSTPHDHEDSNRRIREHSDTGDVLMSPVLKVWSTLRLLTV